jgi:hypothetical protein
MTDETDVKSYLDDDDIRDYLCVVIEEMQKRK